MTQVTEGKRREGMDEREPPTFGVQRADPGPRAARGRLDLLGGRGRAHGLVTWSPKAYLRAQLAWYALLSLVGEGTERPVS